MSDSSPRDMPTSWRERWAILNYLPIPVSVYGGPCERLLFANLAARQCYDESTILQRDWTMRFVSEALAQKAEAELLANGFFTLDAQVRGTEGERWHRLDGRYAEAENGERWLFLTEQDVTVSKHAHADLQETRDQLQQIFPGFVSWVNSKCRYLGVNEHLAALFSLQPEDFIGREVGFNSSDPSFRQILTAFFASDREQMQQEIAIPVQGDLQHYLLLAQKSKRRDRAALVGIDISDRVRVQQQLAHNACHDALTDLPNRAFFLSQLQTALANLHEEPDMPPFVVLFLDLDRFKIINESLGHLVGDRLLVQMAERLRGCIRDSDILARLGGDEFAILLPAVHQIGDAILVAERIVARLKDPLLVRDRECFIGSSIGIAVGTREYKQPEDVLRDADLAMYRAKAQGGNTYSWFDPLLQARALRRLELETDLRQVLETQQLSLHYQPIVDLADNRLLGFEALIRWRHPRKGWISPAEFIPIAEETGQIVSLGEWVLGAVCQQLQTWQTVCPHALPPSVNLNVSAIQLRQTRLADRFREIMQKTGIATSRLKLEITESVLMGKGRPEMNALTALRSQGLALCIDDFGTGYSSLSRLHEIPVSAIKIDRAFIQRLEAKSANDRETGDAFVRTIVGLAASLGAGTVAEGVETSTQRERLLELGCQIGQGYLFSRPLDADAATQFLRDRQSAIEDASKQEAES
ncbi:MAG: EAL domain-containing protein [Cyanobacteria bacterium J06641_5]